ncbi:unnamed protein product [marine sediment metagenome]|uniref:Uncharacterized protein n=1 Tax=marine sediment metagenome TaxID=412755 RepID=X0THS4_9ZZZZ
MKSKKNYNTLFLALLIIISSSLPLMNFGSKLAEQWEGIQEFNQDDNLEAVEPKMSYS